MSDSWRWKVVSGKLEHILPDKPENSVDAVVCDPPYELGFMGKGWDRSGAAFDPEIWAEVLRVLKPGGHLLAFGGTRTEHRMTCAIEDAGFEIRDKIVWMFGSGFPKSLNVSKAIDATILHGGSSTRQLKQTNEQDRIEVGHRFEPDRNNGFKRDYDNIKRVPITAPATDLARQWDGWGTALKPAYEPIVVARKPFKLTVAENVLAFGTGALNIDATRLWTDEHLGRPQNDNSAGKGRWPANLVLSHHPDCELLGTTPEPGYTINRFTDGAKPFGGGAGHPYESTRVGGGEREVYACHPDCPVRLLDESVPQSKSRKGKPRGSQEPGDGWGMTKTGAEYEDVGGPSRYFMRFHYAAKVGRRERDIGCDELPNRNNHCTVKPVSLMRYLVRLVTPPDGLVLDPFSGSGSTGCACLLEGFRFVGIDQDESYVKIAEARLRHVEMYGERWLDAKKEKDAA